MRYAFLTLLSILVISTAVAQPLADRVPSDAIIYVGWRGSENPGAEKFSLTK